MYESSLYDTYKVGKVSNTALNFGWLVMRDDASIVDNVARVSGATPKIVGFVMREATHENRTVDTNDILAGKPISVIRRGTVWVKVKNAAKGGNLYFQKAATDGGAIGDLFGAVGATAADYVQVNGAVCLDTTTAEALCRVEINLPA